MGFVSDAEIDEIVEYLVESTRIDFLEGFEYGYNRGKSYQAQFIPLIDRSKSAAETLVHFINKGVDVDSKPELPRFAAFFGELIGFLRFHHLAFI